MPTGPEGKAVAVTTAQLFAEALATLPVLLRAGAVWLVLLCGVAGLAVYAVVVAVVCGCRWVWRAARSRCAGVWRLRRGGAGSGCLDPAPGPSDANVGTRDGMEAPCAATGGRQGDPQGAGGGFHAPSHPDASEARTAPSWARTDKEAA